MQLNDYLYDKQECKQFHNPRPTDELRFEMMIKPFSYKQRQEAQDKQDAPCGSRCKEWFGVAQIHACENAREELARRVEVGRTEECPAQSYEAEGDEARGGNRQQVVANTIEKRLASLMYCKSYAMHGSP